MKKYLSLLLALVLVLSLTACGQPGPDEQLSAEIDAAMNLDPESPDFSEAIGELMDELDMEVIDEAKALDLVHALGANLSYTVGEVTENDDGTALVSLSATNVDMAQLLPEYLTAVMDSAFGQGFEGGEIPTNEQLADISMGLLIEQLQSPDYGTVTLEAQIPMHWDDEAELWVVDDEEQLADTLYGGMLTWMADEANLESIRPTPSVVLDQGFRALTNEEKRLEMAKHCVGQIVGDVDSGAIEPQIHLDIANGLLGRFTYTLGEQTYERGDDRAVVHATLTNANMGTAMQNFMDKFIAYVYSGQAATGDQLNVEALNLLRECVLDESLELVTTELDIELVWEDGMWVMTDVEAYMDASTGGLFTWAKSMM